MSSGSLKQFLKKTKKNHKTMNEKVTSYYTWMNQANHQNLPTYIVMWGRTIFCGHMQSSITLCQSSLLCFGKAEVIIDSDHVSGPTGLEEMVHSDPVCSQVGSPSSYNRHMGSYAKPVSLFQLSYCFSFCGTVTSTRVTLPSPTATWPVTPSSSSTMGSSRSDQVYSNTSVS